MILAVLGAFVLDTKSLFLILVKKQQLTFLMAKKKSLGNELIAQYGEKTRFAEGNQILKKLTTPELKQEAYRQYCEWIASGKSKRSWCFEHPELTLTWETMEKYIREEPTVFDPLNKQKAETKSLAHWESLGNNMMVGVIEKCQPAIYQMFMRNKFGWDKESKISHSFEPEARTLLKKMEDQQ